MLILSTSNISGTIDLAFVDRADIKQFIGLPTPRAIYAIYHSCLKELTRVSKYKYSKHRSIIDCYTSHIVELILVSFLKTGILDDIGTLTTIQDLEVLGFNSGNVDIHTSELWSLSK